MFILFDVNPWPNLQYTALVSNWGWNESTVMSGSKYRLLLGLNLVAMWLSVRNETCPPTSWHHYFVIWLSKLKLESIVFRGHWQPPCKALTTDKCLSLGLCKETVKQFKLGDLCNPSLKQSCQLGFHGDWVPHQSSQSASHQHGGYISDDKLKIAFGLQTPFADISSFLISTVEDRPALV